MNTASNQAAQTAPQSLHPRLGQSARKAIAMNKKKTKPSKLKRQAKATPAVEPAPANMSALVPPLLHAEAWRWENHRRTQELMGVFLANVSDDDVKAATALLVNRARSGDLAAIRYLLKLVPEIGRVVVEQNH